MKARTNLFRRSLQVYIALMNSVCLPCLAFAIQPIGTIGQPIPEQHAFLSNETILRVVPTHIQMIDARTGAVIDEFGERIYGGDVVFSPTVTHLGIMNPSPYSNTTIVTIWDIKARQQITQWETAGIVRVGAFSPVGALFAISYEDEIHLWNWRTGDFVETMMGERRPRKSCHSNSRGDRACSSSLRDHALVFTPDGRYLIVAGRRPDVELWNVETRLLETHFEGHTGNWVEGAVISPDGRRLATFETDSNEVYLWNVETQQLLWRETNRTGWISNMVFSPDNRHLYVATQTSELQRSGDGPWTGWDDQVHVWDVNAGQQIDVFGTEFQILQMMKLSPDGRTALLHYSDVVVLWDLQEKRVLNVWADFLNQFPNYALSPDGKTVVSMSSNSHSGIIKTWDIALQQMQHLVSADKALFRGFAISPDSKKLAVVRDPWVHIHDLQTGNVETQIPYQVGNAQEMVFSPSGRWLAAGKRWGDLFIFDLKNPVGFQRIQQEHIPVHYYQIAFSEDDIYLAVSGRASASSGVPRSELSRILLWKREANTFVFQYVWNTEGIYSDSHATLAFAYLADGSTVLAVPRRQDTQIWKLLPDDPKLMTTLDGTGPVHFSPDGHYLFTNQYNLQIWDWQTQTPLDHPPIPNYFALSRDGSVLLSHANTGQIHIWDAKALLPSQPVAVDPKGKQIVILGEVKHNQLLQNFPNPFNPETWIPFRLADESHVTIHIYAPTGQLVRRLSQGTMPAGDYASQAKAVYWDGRNQIGELVSSGVYLYTITTGNFSATRKMMIRK